MYLLESDNRPDFNAKKYTDYMDTTHMCLHLAYSFLGSDINTTLSVQAVGEDKTIIYLDTVLQEVLNPGGIEGGESNKVWFQLSVELPAGLNIVMIEGVRGSSNSSGLAIDDVKIFDCADASGE